LFSIYDILSFILNIPESHLDHQPTPGTAQGEVIKTFVQALDETLFESLTNIMRNSFKENYEHVGQKAMSEFLVKVGKQWKATDVGIREVVKQGQGDTKYWKKKKSLQDLKIGIEHEDRRRKEAKGG
jgi:hypothetical protein